MKTFKLKVIASNKVFYDGDCQCLTIPYIDGGAMSFLANHENVVIPLDNGEMKRLLKPLSAMVLSNF